MEKNNSVGKKSDVKALAQLCFEREQIDVEYTDRSLLHVFQFGSWFVAGEYQLFLVLLQVVENVEERVLCLRFSGKELYVVNDEDINHLVEAHEIVSCLVLARSHELLDELLCVDVKDDEIRMIFLCLQSYGVTQVRFPQTGRTEYEQRVESCSSRILRHR